MRKEIAPELYNYNKFPGPDFRQIGTKVLTETIEFDLVDNYKEGILTKFDYIVGDWGNEQLRLRGFYKDDKANESEEKISRLEDYLLEYCNYGCAYFVLENLQPRRASFDKKSHHKKESENKPRRSKQARSYKEEQPKRENRQRSKRQNQKQRARKQSSTKQQQTSSQRHFVIRQK